jgi:hypothetical protein
VAPPESSRLPVPLALVGWLFVAVGVGGIASHGWTFLHASGPGEAADFAWAGGSGALALIGGTFLLLRRGWARWVLAFWMAGHIVLSAMHETEKLVVHVVIFTPIAWILFRRPAAPRGSPSPPSSGAPSPPE